MKQAAADSCVSQQRKDEILLRCWFSLRRSQATARPGFTVAQENRVSWLSLDPALKSASLASGYTMCSLIANPKLRPPRFFQRNLQKKNNRPVRLFRADVIENHPERLRIELNRPRVVACTRRSGGPDCSIRKLRTTSARRLRGDRRSAFFLPPTPGPGISDASSQPLLRQTSSCRQPCVVRIGHIWRFPSRFFRAIGRAQPRALTSVPAGVRAIGTSPCTRPSPKTTGRAFGRCIEYLHFLVERQQPLRSVTIPRSDAE